MKDIFLFYIWGTVSIYLFTIIRWNMLGQTTMTTKMLQLWMFTESRVELVDACVNSAKKDRLTHSVNSVLVFPFKWRFDGCFLRLLWRLLTDVTHNFVISARVCSPYGFEVHKLETIQDLNFWFGIQIKVQLWPLIRTLQS